MLVDDCRVLHKFLSIENQLEKKRSGRAWEKDGSLNSPPCIMCLPLADLTDVFMWQQKYDTKGKL